MRSKKSRLNYESRAKCKIILQANSNNDIFWNIGAFFAQSLRIAISHALQHGCHQHNEKIFQIMNVAASPLPLLFMPIPSEERGGALCLFQCIVCHCLNSAHEQWASPIKSIIALKDTHIFFAVVSPGTILPLPLNYHKFSTSLSLCLFLPLDPGSGISFFPDPGSGLNPHFYVSGNSF